MSFGKIWKWLPSDFHGGLEPEVLEVVRFHQLDFPSWVVNEYD